MSFQTLLFSIVSLEIGKARQISAEETRATALLLKVALRNMLESFTFKTMLLFILWEMHQKILDNILFLLPSFPSSSPIFLFTQLCIPSLLKTQTTTKTHIATCLGSWWQLTQGHATEGFSQRHNSQRHSSQRHNSQRQSFCHQRCFSATKCTQYLCAAQYTLKWAGVRVCTRECTGREDVAFTV